MKDILKDFIKKEPFFIFDEHDLTDDKGNKLFSVTKDVLEEIAENNNRRIRETGDYSPIVIGHTRNGVSEDKQPKVVGYAAHYKVKPFFNTGRYAIQVTPFFDPEHIDEAKKYTRRSVEYWPNRKEIDPIALLGATTPERDLGVYHYSRNSDSFHYSREFEAMPADMKPEEGKEPKVNAKADPEVDKLLAALKETAEWKFLEQLKQEVEGMGGEEGGQAPPQGGMPAAPPMGGQGPPPMEQPIKNSGMTPAPVSGTNGFVPGGPKQEPQRMSRETEDQVIRLSRQNQDLVTRYESMARNLNDLNMKYRREQRKVDLITLENEGYIFDMDEELDTLTPQDDINYKKSLDKIRKRYQRGPIVSDAIVSSQRAVKYSRSGRTKDQVDAIVEYATKTGVTFDVAAEKLAGQGVL